MGRIPAHDYERLGLQLPNEGWADGVHVAVMVRDSNVHRARSLRDGTLDISPRRFTVIRVAFQIASRIVTKTAVLKSKGEAAHVF